MLTIRSQAAFQSAGPAVLAGVAILGGVVWLIVVTSLNVATQFRLPDWIRARGLATYQIAFQGCLALGGLIWGVLADAAGVEGALAVASAAVLLGTLGGTRWSLASGEALDLHPAAPWPAPNVARAPEPEEGPVLVTKDDSAKPMTQDGN